MRSLFKVICGLVADQDSNTPLQNPGIPDFNYQILTFQRGSEIECKGGETSVGRKRAIGGRGEIQ